MKDRDNDYCRVYHTIVDDEKFAEVYDNDAALATWLRLLIIADQAWPASAHLPGNVKRRTVELLERVGIIHTQPGWRYRVHGLDAEREKRAQSARDAAAKRWHSGSNAPASDTRMPSRAEPSKAEPSHLRAPEGWPHLDADAVAGLEQRTGQPWSLAGDKQLAELDRLIGDHGAAKVFAAFDAVSEGKRMTARQLIWPALRLLEPFPDPKAAAADDSAERDRAASRRRSEATYRQTHALGAHAKQRNPLCPLCQENAA